MAALIWDEVGKRFYQAGVDRGVLYPTGTYGVAWNGLIGVNESPSGGAPVPQYMDGVKYREDSANEEYSASLEAFTYPDEFTDADGLAFDENGLGYAHQARQPFCFSYRTMIGNDVDGMEHAYQMHIVYNAMASPTEKPSGTTTDSPDPTTFSWDLTTVPVMISGRAPTAHIVLDSRRIDPGVMGVIETLMYGSEGQDPILLWPWDLQELFGGWVMPWFYVPYIWLLSDDDPFPEEALDGDGAYDDSTDNVWVNDTEPQQIALSPQMWDLTEEPEGEFPPEALDGDLGYDRFTGEVWRNETGIPSDRMQEAVFRGTYIPVVGFPFPNVTDPGEAWLITGHLWIYLGDDWYDSGPPVPIE